eukprot:1325180-Amphidinium_carterae.1
MCVGTVLRMQNEHTRLTWPFVVFLQCVVHLACLGEQVNADLVPSFEQNLYTHAAKLTFAAPMAVVDISGIVDVSRNSIASSWQGSDTDNVELTHSTLQGPSNH